MRRERTWRDLCKASVVDPGVLITIRVRVWSKGSLVVEFSHKYFTAASSRGHPRTTRGYPRPGGNVTKKGRGYPRDHYVPDPPTVISPAAGDIPGRVGDIPGRSGISPAASRGCPRRAGTSPAFGAGHPRPARGCSRPFGGCPARVLVVGAAHATHMCVCHITRSKPTQRHVERRLCDTTRPSEGSCCAAVAAARAALVPGGEARTSEPHSEASGGQSRPQTPRCAPLYGAPSSTEQTSRRGPDSARSDGCGRPPSRRACGTGRSVAEACASKEPRPGAVESWSRARRRQPARAHADCREPPSLAAQERG